MSGSTSRRLAGVTSFAIDGTAYQLVGDVMWKPAIRKRETLVGLDGIHGYSETFEAAHISATLRDSAAISMADFNAMTDVTVVVVAANGKTISGSGLWVTEAQEVKGAEGTFEVRFEGDELIEV